jgi:nanoRNase/pAp phosphatase (c-di-AMP/oligoRNAs hydrolase)
MTAFVESCVETAAGSAAQAERRSRGRPRARRLLKLLASKQKILITTHQHPDPDGLASAIGLREMLCHKLPQADVSVSVKGRVGGGLNDAFVRFSKLNLTDWNEKSLADYDAIILVDVQPHFAYSPLPEGIEALAVIDHHSRHGRRRGPAYLDVRTDVGATCSIVFSYFMETETPISASLAATMLYGIETDLAGAAGAPTELDNIALSSLTLLADTRKLYQMRYVDLPREYYVAYSEALASAVFYEHALMSHIGTIDSLEKPAVMADFLMRFDQVDWALVTAVYGSRLILSLRTSNARLSAADVMRKLVRGAGEGGGHRTKAGGCVPMQSTAAAELDRTRARLLRRYLAALGIKQTKGQALVGPVG